METSKFDIADYLDSNEMIAEYLNAVLEEGNDAEIVSAIGHIAKAIGMTKIAEETGMSRPSLYKALSEGAKPQFSTIMKVLKAVGGQIHIKSINRIKNKLTTHATSDLGFRHNLKLIIYVPKFHLIVGNSK